MVIFHSYVNVYQRVIRDIIPKWPQFRLVKYDNLPRYLCIATLLMTPSNPSNPSSMAHMEGDSTKKAWDLSIYLFCFCVEKTTTSNVWTHVVAIPCPSPMGFQKPNIFWLSRGSPSIYQQLLVQYCVMMERKRLERAHLPVLINHHKKSWPFGAVSLASSGSPKWRL